jgi:hypothetical protein
MVTASDHEVYIDWRPEQTGAFWNELCANIMEVFGLPGTRYVSSPTEDYMIFTFKNKKDADMCRILLSEHL